MEKIRRISLFFKIIFQIIFITMPIPLVICWIYAPDQLVLLNGLIRLDAIPHNYQGMHTFTGQGIPEKILLHTLTLGQKTLGCFVSAIPMMVKMFILTMLIKLFGYYGERDIFSMNNVKYIRNIGYALLVGQIIEPICQFVMGFILTMHNPPHHHFATISLDQSNVGTLLTALLVILISWVMLEASKLRDEQQLTV